MLAVAGNDVERAKEVLAAQLAQRAQKIHQTQAAAKAKAKKKAKQKAKKAAKARKKRRN